MLSRRKPHSAHSNAWSAELRNAYEPIPWLAADNTPAVSATSGLGTGGGAGVQTPDSSGFGDIYVYVGAGVATSGSVALTFPNTPPTLFISADQAFGTLTQATVSDVVTISWTGAAFKSPGGGKKYNIHYEWLTST